MFKFIAGLVVLSGIGAIIFYFVNDPFQTRVASEANPAEFLASCLDKLDGFDHQLQGRQVALHTQQNEFSRERDLQLTRFHEISTRLELLKTAYRSGQRTGIWPVSAPGLEGKLTESDARNSIIDANRKVTRLSKRISLYQQTLCGISENLAEAEKTVGQIAEQRLLISAKLEEFKLKRAVSAVDQIPSEVAAIGNQTGTITTKQHVLSIDDGQQSAPEAATATKDDPAFQQILAAK
jgi:uncharacterized coiled-coil protein SlyX